MPTDRVLEPDAELTADLADSEDDASAMRGDSEDTAPALTAEQERLCQQGFRALARMIVQHAINHPDESKKWIGDVDDDADMDALP